MRDLDLAAFRRNVYSQNGEDGVIAEILRRLQINTGSFCEFGAWDGRYGSNCYKLLRDGWKGVMIEGDHLRYNRLAELGRRHRDRLITIESYVSSDPKSDCRLDALLAGTSISQEFELLSIDIDGLDYQVWEALVNYRPSVVIIEINSSIPPGIPVVHALGGDGSSFSATLMLGLSKGYRLVAHTGNMFFVRDDLIKRLNLPAHDLETPESLFVWDWVDPTRTKELWRKLKFMTPQRAIIKMENWLKDRRPLNLPQ